MTASSPTDLPDPTDPLRAAEGLVELLSETAAEAECNRSLSPEVITAAEQSGIFATVTPRSHGGMGLGLDAIGDATRVMAHGCCASAWTLSFLMLHNWFIAHFPSAARDEAWAKRPFAHMAAPLAPTGTAARTARGWRIDGRWEWATGVNHAEWVMVHALDEDTKPPEGSPFATRFALVPIHPVTVQDLWHTSGMRATGSNAVVIDGVVVPDDHTVTGTTMLYPGNGGGTLGEDCRLDRLPMMAVLALVAAAPALGAAEAVVRSFEDRMRDRVLAYTMGDRQGDQPAARVRLATALAETRAAGALWSSAIASLARAGESAAGATLADRADARLAAATVVKMARSAISTVAEGSGASVYAQSSPLQRFQRDIEVLKGHVVFDWDRSAELAGRVRLGMELGPTDLV